MPQERRLFYLPTRYDTVGRNISAAHCDKPKQSFEILASMQHAGAVQRYLQLAGWPKIAMYRPLSRAIHAL